MADPPADPGPPRWAKVFALIFAAVVILFAILLFTRGPHHGPRQHAPLDGGRQPAEHGAREP